MKKKLFYLCLVVLGLALAVFGVFFFRGEEVRNIGGVCLGIGAGIFGAAVSKLFMLNFYEKHPKEYKQESVESADERNIMIRNKAKAKSADIVQWFIMGIAYICILIKAPLWLTLCIISVFLLKNMIEMFLMNKYAKEM